MYFPNTEDFQEDRLNKKIVPQERVAELIGWEWLLSRDGEEAICTLTQSSIKDELKKVEFLRKKNSLTQAQAHLVLEQARLRERAGEKFGIDAKRMMFTPVGLEQSTDCWIASYKATRFPAGMPVVDVCCGIGGDLMALALEHPVMGVDCNPRTAMVAEYNLRAVLNHSVPNTDGWNVACITAEDFLKTSQAKNFPCVHVDPDRRSEGVRTTRMDYFEPSQEVVEQLIAGKKVVAVKLAPGTEIPVNWWERASEVEWIGRNRECRQLLVWFFADMPKEPEKKVRATIIDAHTANVLISVCGKQHRKVPIAEKPGKYVFDIDSTFLVAGLDGELASRYGLKRIGEGGVYLTGDVAISDCAALSCFEILKVLPLDRKQIVKEVRERNWRNIEIKKRGNVPEPEAVRRWFKFPSTGDSGTLILVSMSPKNVAIIAKRVN